MITETFINKTYFYSKKGGNVDRNLALEFVRATEAAALSSARWMGRGNEKEADNERLFSRVQPDNTRYYQRKHIC